MARPVKRDGGYGWVICLSLFIVEVLVDGIRFSYGLYFVEFLAEFKKNKAETAWIGGIMVGVYNLGGPMFAFIVNKVGYRKASLIGSVIGASGLLLSSFSKEVYHLYFSYGALQGFGDGLVFLSGTVAISRYFLKKRALAIGISYCGSGVGLFLLPPLVKLLFETYSWRGSLLILTGMMLNCCVCSSMYRPFHSSDVNFDEVDVVNDCDKAEGNSSSVKSTNGHAALETQISPLLSNDNKTVIHIPVNGKKPISPSMPRSFAEMRKEQILVHRSKEQNNIASNRSITRAVLSQGIFGSNASFEYIIEKRNKTRHSLLSISQPNTKSSVVDDKLHRKHFKSSVIESVFPKELVTNVNFIIMLISTFLIGVPSFIPFSMLPDYALSSGATSSQAAWLLSAIGIGGTIGRIGAGVLSDMQCVNNLILNSVCYLIIGAGVIVSAVFPHFEVLMSSAVLFGLFYGAIYVVQPVVLLEYIGEEYVIEFMGILMSVYGVSSFVGSPLAGWIFDITGSYRTTFLVAGIMFILGGVVNFLVLCTKASRNNRKKARQEQEVVRQSTVEINT